MKTYETLDHKFVSEDPGLENTILGRDSKNTPIVMGSILCQMKYFPSECSLNKIVENNVNWLNYYIRTGYLVISAREASHLAKSKGTRIYGNYKSY